MKFSISKLLLILMPLFSYSAHLNAQGSQFFDFDQVDFYSISISNKDISNIEYQRKRNSFEYKKISKKDALFLSILQNNYPEKVDDKFSEKLLKYGFKKKTVDKILYPEINTIFSEKDCNDNLGSFCIPTFRDIFIFTKNNKVVGISKVCYDCGLATIIGTEKNIRNFGSCGDFKKLKKLMGNK